MLLCVPIILYTRPLLDSLFGFYGAYAFLCFFPGVTSLIAFGLYRIGRGTLWPVLFGILGSIGFGATFTYSVAMQVLVPILPHNIFEVFIFLQRLELTWPLIASSSVLRSEEHTSELQSLMRISYAVFCLNKKQNHHTLNNIPQ